MTNEQTKQLINDNSHLENSMKKFKVSLCVLIPANYEIEIEAENANQAAKLATEEFENEAMEGIIDSEEYENAVSAWSDNDSEISELTTGIYVNEILEK